MSFAQAVPFVGTGIPKVVGLLVGLVIGALVGAVILRAAVDLYNKLAGSKNAISEPSMGRATVIVLATAIVNWIVSFCVIAAIRSGPLLAGPKNVLVLQMVALSISLPIAFLVMSGMLAYMLPTKFGRAILVALLHTAIVAVVGLCLGALVAALVMVVWGNSW